MKLRRLMLTGASAMISFLSLILFSFQDGKAKTLHADGGTDTDAVAHMSDDAELMCCELQNLGVDDAYGL
jgi:hypothetical protein